METVVTAISALDRASGILGKSRWDSAMAYSSTVHFRLTYYGNCAIMHLKIAQATGCFFGVG